MKLVEFTLGVVIAIIVTVTVSFCCGSAVGTLLFVGLFTKYATDEFDNLLTVVQKRMNDNLEALKVSKEKVNAEVDGR